MRNLAVLMTCHNRRENTLKCLKALFLNAIPEDLHFKVFLVDDGSNDGTAEVVSEQFPGVVLVRADGTLYWNGGMRVAFGAALEMDFDFYLWLNDDTFLFSNALSGLLMSYEFLPKDCRDTAILSGTTIDPMTKASTYGGQKWNSTWKGLDFRFVEPGEQPIECDTMNGNCVLIPRNVAQRVGNLEKEFIHSMGDIDYGLRAKSLGCSIWVSAGFVGECTENPRADSYYDRALSRKVRLHKMLHPKGLPIRQWKLMTKRHLGVFWFVYWLLPYARAIFLPQVRK